MAKVIFEFDYYDDKEEVDILRGAKDTSIAMGDINEIVRDCLNKNELSMDENIVDVFDEIRRISWEHMP